MKKKSTMSAILVLLIMGFGCASCSGDGDEPRNPDRIEMSAESPREIIADCGGGMYTVTFTSENEWNAECDSDWMRVSQSFGNGGRVQLNIYTDPNTTYDERIGRIKITSGRSASSEILVTQPQKDAIVLSKHVYSLSYKAQDFSLTAGHNVAYDMKCDVDWISRADTRSFTEEKLIFKIEPNITTEQRTGVITFTSKDGAIEQNVRIEQQARKLNHIYKFKGALGLDIDHELIEEISIRVNAWPDTALVEKEYPDLKHFIDDNKILRDKNGSIVQCKHEWMTFSNYYHLPNCYLIRKTTGGWQQFKDVEFTTTVPCKNMTVSIYIRKRRPQPGFSKVLGVKVDAEISIDGGKRTKFDSDEDGAKKFIHDNQFFFGDAEAKGEFSVSNLEYNGEDRTYPFCYEYINSNRLTYVFPPGVIP